MAYTCKYCSTNFSEKRTLKRHIKSKHEVTNFRCQKCEFTTTRKDKLREHTFSKHYGNKFKCPECSEEFSRNDSLARHMKTYHPKDPLAPIPIDWVEEIEREEKLLAEPRTPDPVVFTPAPTPTPTPAPIVTPVEKSAFNKRLVEKKWFIRGQKDILKVFMNYRERVNNAVTRALRKHQLKIDLVIKVRMSRQDQEGEQQEVSQAFYGGQKLILRAEDFHEAYDESVKKIWGDFDKWLSNGSGWVLERVENLYLNSAKYDPIYGRSYVPTLKGIAAKKAVVNVQNQDNQCFKWAVLSALHPLAKHANRGLNYKKLENELDFTGNDIPVKSSSFLNFS